MNVPVLTPKQIHNFKKRNGKILFDFSTPSASSFNEHFKILIDQMRAKREEYLLVFIMDDTFKYIYILI